MSAQHAVHKRLSPFLARQRELQGRMCKGIVLIGSPHLTKRALDAGESARFLGVFSASTFFSVDGVPPSAPVQVTHTVRCRQRNEINDPKLA